MSTLNRPEDKASIRGVIYARYSSSGQREESIEGQIRDCSEYAARHGITIVDTYEDRAITGRTDRRPGFQKMIRDSARGQFSVVICWKNDRFARSRYDSAIYKARLKQNGVRILYAKEEIPDGPEGIILESIMEGYAEYYSANLSQNVKRGNYDSALKRQTCGVMCFGLRTGADKRFEIDPVTGPIVRRIFDEYVGGKSAKEICADLNKDGFRTTRGGEFNKNSIRRIIQNERYCGVYEYAGVRDENGVPPIVDKDTWQKAQKILNVHHRNKSPAKEDGGYLLTGKLFCGHCGEPMTGMSGRGKLGNVYYYYACNSVRYRKGTCKKRNEVRKYVEDLIVSELVKIVQNDDFIEEIADHFMEWQAEQQKTNPVAGFENELRKVNTAIRNNIALVDSGLISESVRIHLVDLEKRKAELETSIAKASIAAPVIERDAVVWFLQSFRSGNADDTAWRIYLVDTFLKAAYLYDDKLTLFLNTSGNSCVDVSLADVIYFDNDGPDGFANCAVRTARWRSHEHYAKFCLIKGLFAVSLILRN